MQMKNKNLGLTLIELLVVLTIIALVGAVVAPQVLNKVGGAKSTTTKMQIDDLGAALDLFYLDTGDYPSTDEGLQALVEAPAGSDNWNGPYLKKSTIPKDPWKHDFHYQSPGEHGEYDLYSYGKDGAPGGEDENTDIVSWE